MACREHEKARSILIGLRAASLEATDDEVQRLAGYLWNKQVELTANIFGTPSHPSTEAEAPSQFAETFDLLQEDDL